MLMRHDVRQALWVSVGVTLLALAAFGSVKGYFTGVKPWRGGLQTVLVGGLAVTSGWQWAALGLVMLLPMIAGSAFLCVRFLRAQEALRLPTVKR